MTFPDILTVCMVLFMFVGVLDHIFGNRFGLGEQFLEGFRAFGSLAVTMTGVLVLLPYLEAFLGPVLTPVCTALGIDPAMLAGIFLACDMGGLPLAQSLAASPEGAGLGGMILGSMMGANIVFNIPVALGIVPKEDRRAMSKGILCGFIAIPAGCFFGGLTAGYGVLTTLRHLLPVIVISLAIALLLWLVPEGITKAFLLFGKVIAAVSALAAALAIGQTLTGFVILPGLGDIREAMDLVVNIVLVLPGAYVMVTLLSRLLAKPFRKLGGLLQVNETSTLGLLTTIANAVPTIGLIRDMDERGKILNFAFLVSAGYLLGDHMAFCSAFMPEMVLPMIVGKFTGGLCGLALALFMTRQKQKTDEV